MNQPYLGFLDIDPSEIAIALAFVVTDAYVFLYILSAKTSYKHYLAPALLSAAWLILERRLNESPGTQHPLAISFIILSIGITAFAPFLRSFRKSRTLRVEFASGAVLAVLLLVRLVTRLSSWYP